MRAYIAVLLPTLRCTRGSQTQGIITIIIPMYTMNTGLVRRFDKNASYLLAPTY